MPPAAGHHLQPKQRRRQPQIPPKLPCSCSSAPTPHKSLPRSTPAHESGVVDPLNHWRKAMLRGQRHPPHAQDDKACSAGGGGVRRHGRRRCPRRLRLLRHPPWLVEERRRLQRGPVALLGGQEAWSLMPAAFLHDIQTARWGRCCRRSPTASQPHACQTCRAASAYRHGPCRSFPVDCVVSGAAGVFGQFTCFLSPQDQEITILPKMMFCSKYPNLKSVH